MGNNLFTDINNGLEEDRVDSMNVEGGKETSILDGLTETFNAFFRQEIGLDKPETVKKDSETGTEEDEASGNPETAAVDDEASGTSNAEQTCDADGTGEGDSDNAEGESVWDALAEKLDNLKETIQDAAGDLEEKMSGGNDEDPTSAE